MYVLYVWIAFFFFYNLINPDSTTRIPDMLGGFLNLNNILFTIERR